jgi:hypothetical protein
MYLTSTILLDAPPIRATGIGSCEGRRGIDESPIATRDKEQREEYASHCPLPTQMKETRAFDDRISEVRTDFATTGPAPSHASLVANPCTPLMVRTSPGSKTNQTTIIHMEIPPTALHRTD